MEDLNLITGKYEKRHHNNFKSTSATKRKKPQVRYKPTFNNHRLPTAGERVRTGLARPKTGMRRVDVSAIDYQMSPEANKQSSRDVMDHRTWITQVGILP